MRRFFQSQNITKMKIIFIIIVQDNLIERKWQLFHQIQRTAFYKQK